MNSLGEIQFTEFAVLERESAPRIYFKKDPVIQYAKFSELNLGFFCPPPDFKIKRNQYSAKEQLR